MSYKILIFAPSAGGKSTLMRYLREHTNLFIAEIDEEIMSANNDIWPSDELKNGVLIPQITKEIINHNSVIFFTNHISLDLLQEARGKGFKVIMLEIDMPTLLWRDQQRMSIEKYQDTTPWLQREAN